MRDRRGPVGRVTGLAEEVASAMRRRQRDREPRVVLYDSAGHPRALRPDSPGHHELLETAERIVEAVGEDADADADGSAPVA